MQDTWLSKQVWPGTCGVIIELQLLSWPASPGGELLITLWKKNIDILKQIAMLLIVMTKYTTFKRSCNGWESFAQARKITVDKGLSYDEAKRQCKEFNDNRTKAQIRRGTMMEFISQ